VAPLAQPGTGDLQPHGFRASFPGEPSSAFGALFAASAAVTILWCASISRSGDPKPGGWTMSMAWMPDARTGRGRHRASFLGMWVVMNGGDDAAVPGPDARR